MSEDQEKRGSGGVIVLLPEDPESIATEGGIRPSALHCTLCYLGLTEGGPVTQAKARYVLSELTATWRPIEANVLGLDFLGNDDPQAVVMRLTSAPSLIRAAVMVALPEIPPSIFPTFIPHMTQGYGTVPNREPVGKWIKFDRIGLWWGNDRDEYELSA